MPHLAPPSRLALGLLCAALAAGCGAQHAPAPSGASSVSGGAPPASGGSAPASGGSAPASGGSAADGTLPACQAQALTVTVDAAQSGAAAGSTYVPVDFTSTAVAPCTLAGYPAVSFATGPLQAGQVGAAAARLRGFPGVRVTLGPGRPAHAWLQVAAAQNYPAAACEPVTAHWLRVTPPGGTAAAYVGRAFDACRSASAQILAVMPVRPGRAARGAIP